MDDGHDREPAPAVATVGERPGQPPLVVAESDTLLGVCPAARHDRVELDLDSFGHARRRGAYRTPAPFAAFVS
jgi:hypothetical protein